MNEHQYIVNEEKQREQIREEQAAHSTPHKMAAFRGLLLLFVGLQLAQCKHAGGTLKLNSDITEQYISKFSFTCKLRWLLPRRLRLQRAATAVRVDLRQPFTDCRPLCEIAEQARVRIDSADTCAEDYHKKRREREDVAGSSQ